MIPARYPAPAAQRIFNDGFKYSLWKEITDAYALEYATEFFQDDSRVESVRKALITTNPPTPEMVAEYEAETGHDVVAFIAAYVTKLPGDLGFLIHDGLTSSDLVDYGLFQQVSMHADDVNGQIRTLLEAATAASCEAIRPGRTHGQIASHTSWAYQISVHVHTLLDIRVAMGDFADHGAVVKYPGPTGWPGEDGVVFARGRRVADLLDCVFTPGTQIIHRDRLLEWAAVYLRLACALENLAQLVRAGARAEIHEVREGFSRVGSSSVPHKQNPIDSEKVCGLARVARGHMLAIAESVATWDDRDISNSSVERIAVPGLASTVEHMLHTMTKIFLNLRVDEELMRSHAGNPETKTHIMQTTAQRMLRISPVEASALVRQGIAEYPHYPGMWIRSVADRIHDQYGGGDAVWRKQVAEEWKSHFDSEAPGPG